MGVRILLRLICLEFHDLSLKKLYRVCRLLVVNFYDRFVRLPATDQEWATELRGFLENNVFPCNAAWDGFHIGWQTKMKNH